MSRRVALGALVVYTAALAAIVLAVSPDPALEWTTDALRRVEVLGRVTVRAVERGANVVLFVPAGLLLSYALPRTPRALVWALCVLVSLGVEAAQVVLPGRDATPIDVVTNAIGAGIGVLLHAAVARRPARDG
jgi:glycopeptide antibiotics resistance protein